jgi:hypothetical protein
MSLSIQLARIFSVYFIIVGLSLLMNRSFFRAATKEIASNNVAMLIIASTTLILGAILVNLHNIWVHDWRIAITLLCWVVMLSGAVRTLFPTVVQGMARRLSIDGGTYLRFASIVCLALGVLYAYLGR